MVQSSLNKMSVKQPNQDLQFSTADVEPKLDAKQEMHEVGQQTESKIFASQDNEILNNNLTTFSKIDHKPRTKPHTKYNNAEIFKKFCKGHKKIRSSIFMKHRSSAKIETDDEYWGSDEKNKNHYFKAINEYTYTYDSSAQPQKINRFKLSRGSTEYNTKSFSTITTQIQNNHINYSNRLHENKMVGYKAQQRTKTAIGKNRHKRSISSSAKVPSRQSSVTNNKADSQD